MTLTEDIKNLQQQGFSDEQIIQSLREKNVSYREIADALAQSRIKAAVEDPNTEPQNAFPAPSPSEEYAGTRPMEGMEPSIMATESNQRPELTAPSPTYADTPSPQEYGQQYADSYAQYAQQPQSQQGASPDLIAEIADQIMTEKLGDIRKHLEKIIDMKTTFDSKIEYVDERLKKIEKIIDALQLSILRKVGDYVTNVQDLKSELLETQKTFSKLLPSRNKPAQSAQHQNTQQHHQNQRHQQGKHHPHEHKNQ
ncbi:MAG TPA: hypothetical protein VJK07_00220 [Candidatus Nanoarchaeia archaeon]|nr:hypothetical protein [Candidatus Nanoarchaeia archaeon]